MHKLISDQQLAMPKRPESLLRRYDVWEPNTDKFEFQWQSRLLQSIWREKRGLVAGNYRGRVRGARLKMPEAKTTLANYLNESIRSVVRSKVDDPAQARGKLFGKPRIYNNLLSSQPLCFNLFAELSLDLKFASVFFQEMTNGRVHEVTEVDFEFSPGRGDVRFTGDRSAFDVYVRYKTQSNGSGFIGIEVKYHEGLNDPVAEHRRRYDEVASEMGCFLTGELPALQEKPLQQIWRDHLLVGAHQIVNGFDDAFFVFLYPKNNSACAKAVKKYKNCLSRHNSFEEWTLEDVVGRLMRLSSKKWIVDFHERYVDFSRLPL